MTFMVLVDVGIWKQLKQKLEVRERCKTVKAVMFQGLEGLLPIASPKAILETISGRGDSFI